MFHVSMTGWPCSVPRVDRVPVSSRNRRPAGGLQAEPAGGQHPQEVGVRDQRHVPSASSGRTRASAASARAPTCSTVSPG